MVKKTMQPPFYSGGRAEIFIALAGRLLISYFNVKYLISLVKFYQSIYLVLFATPEQIRMTAEAESCKNITINKSNKRMGR
ncbi:hypothetical protein CSQ88_13090 [Iodobacter sp. BJB302]|nr:hypothetical protein CSQ88_13090 [Iodobacter sp. BJB302]